MRETISAVTVSKSGHPAACDASCNILAVHRDPVQRSSAVLASINVASCCFVYLVDGGVVRRGQPFAMSLKSMVLRGGQPFSSKSCISF